VDRIAGSCISASIRAGACFEWRATVKVHGCADEIAVRVVGIQGQSNRWKSGSCVAPMMADAGGINGILVGGEDLWNRSKNLWRRLILQKVFTEEWTMESAGLISSPVVLRSRKYDEG